MEVLGLNPTACCNKSVDAYVTGTSPSLMGSNILLNITFLPVALLKHFSNVSINTINFSGLLFPILKTL